MGPLVAYGFDAVRRLEGWAPALSVGAMMEWGSVFRVGMAKRLSRENVPGHLDRLYHHGEIASFLRAQQGPVRVWVFGCGDSLQFRGAARDTDAAGFCGECDPVGGGGCRVSGTGVGRVRRG